MPKKAEISLALNGIEEVYSSFDDRPQGERDLSRNLLNELMEKAGGKVEISTVEFRIKKKFNEKERETAIKRLCGHFSKEEERGRKMQWVHRFNGTAYVILGGVLLTAQSRTDFGQAANILLFPAGWFLIFLGAEHVIADWKLRPMQRTLRKLKTARVLISKS